MTTRAFPLRIFVVTPRCVVVYRYCVLLAMQGDFQQNVGTDHWLSDLLRTPTNNSTGLNARSTYVASSADDLRQL